MNENLLIKSFFIGFFGDALLQLIVRYYTQKGRNFAGLHGYFAQHGVFESLCIAGGIMFLATFVFMKLKIPINMINLFIYGGLLDVLWRQLNLMPSLKNTYYATLNPVESFIWGGIPMLLILLFK